MDNYIWPEFLVSRDQLSMRDQQTAARIIQRGHPVAAARAVEILVEANAKYAISRGCRYAREWTPAEDFVQDALIALNYSAWKYKPQNIPFILYARPIIDVFTRRGDLAINHPVRLPASSSRQMKLGGPAKMIARANHLALNGPPSGDGRNQNEEIGRFIATYESGGEDISDDANKTIDKDMEVVVGFVIDAYRECCRRDNGRYGNTGKNAERDIGVVMRYYGIGQSAPEGMVDIGKSLGLSHQRISQIIIDFIDAIQTRPDFAEVREEISLLLRG